MIKNLLNKIFVKKVIENGNIISTFSIFNEKILRFRDYKIVFDIGAYHGAFTNDILTENAEIVVHAFEPYNKAYEILRQKFEKKNVVPNNIAISNIVVTTELFVNNFDETNSLLASNNIDESIDVLTKTISSQKIEVTTLDKYCILNNIRHIDFIKIDTQGNSYNVLLGAKHLLESKSIKFLYIETEFVNIYKNQKVFSEIELLMKDFGYQLVNFYNMNFTQDGRLAWCDSLFTIK